MTGGGGNETVTQSNKPWAPQGAALKNIFGEAGNLYKGGALGALGDQSQATLQAQGMTADRALGGGYGLNDQAAGLAGQTIGGNFLSQNNPYLQGAIEYGQQPVIDAWNEQIAPGIDATFSGRGGAGALGSGAYAAARNRGEDTLARNLSGAATQAAYQNYGDERSRQQQALALAPGIEQGGYANIDRLGQVGAQQDYRAQQIASQPLDALQQYAGLINSSPSFSQYATTQPGQDNTGQYISSGVGGAALLGSLFI